jgi:hypothetical protein
MNDIIYKKSIFDSISLMTILFSRIHTKCLEIIANKFFNKKITAPWMHYIEIEMMKTILKNVQPQKCLEWGSGYSTIFFPNFVKKNCEWISLEHNKNWVEKIKNLNKNPSVKIFHMPPNNPDWKKEYADGTYSAFKSYIEFPVKYGQFDFIFIDGRARKDCLIKAAKLIKDEGAVVLHDARRTHYHEPFKLFEHQILFDSDRGLWIGSKGRPIEEILNVDKYKMQWHWHNKIRKMLKGF